MIFRSNILVYLSIAILSLTPVMAATTDLAVLKETSRAFNRVAQAGIAAVVNISATRSVSTPKQPFSPQNPHQQSPFDYFFGDEFFKQYFDMPPADQTSLGSGVIVSPDGYIITNYHVIENASDIMITLATQEEKSAQIIGSDPRTDIAVLKVETETPLPTVLLGDSDALQVGDWAIAVGSPFGLSKSVTAGIISATGRSNVGIVDYENFIQTDAAINPGNSGGALLDIDGQLIGINTAIFTKSGGYNGIGFAIPINSVQKVMADLIEHGQVIRGWIGVIIQAITPELRQQLGLSSNQGALISDVVPDGPAEQAGLKRGDVVIAVNGKSVGTYNDLRNSISETAVDETVTLDIIRKQKRISKRVSVAAYPEDSGIAAKTNALPDKLGIRVEATQTKDGSQEVVIQAVEPRGPASGVLKKGDVILEINNKPVPTLAAYTAIMTELKPGKTVLLWVRRGLYSQYIVIDSR